MQPRHLWGCDQLASLPPRENVFLFTTLFMNLSKDIHYKSIMAPLLCQHGKIIAALIAVIWVIAKIKGNKQFQKKDIFFKLLKNIKPNYSWKIPYPAPRIYQISQFHPNWPNPSLVLNNLCQNFCIKY